MSFDSSALAQLDAGEVGLMWLVQMDFVGGTQYLSTFTQRITIDGNEYRGFGGLLRVGDMRESQAIRGDQVTVSLPLANDAMLALVLGSVENYRGRDCRLYAQLIDRTFRPVGAPNLRFTGRMQPVGIKRDRAQQGSYPGTVEMQLARAGLQRSRRLEGRKLTDAQQRAEFPGDTGLRYVRSLVEQPALWLSKKFQEQ